MGNILQKKDDIPGFSLMEFGNWLVCLLFYPSLYLIDVKANSPPKFVPRQFTVMGKLINRFMGYSKVFSKFLGTVEAFGWHDNFILYIQCMQPLSSEYLSNTIDILYVAVV